MSSAHHGIQSDAEFERSLLQSAQADAPPDNVQEAWARFATVMNVVASGAEQASGLFKAGPKDDDSGANIARATTARAGYGNAVKWLLLGAIGGSGLTAAVMLERQGARLRLAPLAVNAAFTTAIRASDSPNGFERVTKAYGEPSLASAHR